MDGVKMIDEDKKRRYFSTKLKERYRRFFHISVYNAVWIEWRGFYT